MREDERRRKLRGDPSEEEKAREPESIGSSIGYPIPGVGQELFYLSVSEIDTTF